MKRFLPVFLVAMMAAVAVQSPRHPFDAGKIHATIDTFVVVTRVTSGGWRPVGGVVQTIARDTTAIRLAVDYSFIDSKQRVEMAMDPTSLAPLAHWESLTARGRGDTRGEVRFSDGRARGAFILSRSIFDIPLDTGVVDDDASTALLPTLPLEMGRAFTFRTFATPGEVRLTRAHVAGIDTVSVPAGTFEAWRLVVMSRDTSHVFISRTAPRRVVLVRLSDGSQEMRLVSRAR